MKPLLVSIWRLKIKNLIWAEGGGMENINRLLSLQTYQLYTVMILTCSSFYFDMIFLSEWIIKLLLISTDDATILLCPNWVLVYAICRAHGYTSLEPGETGIVSVFPSRLLGLTMEFLILILLAFLGIQPLSMLTW
jgi:hypothetical protein